MRYAIVLPRDGARVLFVAREDAAEGLKAVSGSTGGFLAVNVAFASSSKSYTYFVDKEVAVGDHLSVETDDGRKTVVALPAPKGESKVTGYASYVLRKQDMLFPIQRYRTAEKI